MIEVLKQALEALESMANEGWLLHGPEGMDVAQTKCVKAITSLRQAIAKLESQEPVAWLLTGNAPLFDGEIIVHMSKPKWIPEWWRAEPLYTHPPQRKPLTDEQISDLWCKVSNTDFVTADTHEFARAIEAAHGITGENNGTR